MFCIGEQTVCLRDGMTVTFKNVIHKHNIVEIVDERGETMHQLHFLKGGEVVKIETLPLTGSRGSGKGSEPVGAPHSPVGD